MAGFPRRRCRQHGMLDGEGPAESIMASLPTQRSPARRDLSVPVNDELLRRICELPGEDWPREGYANWLEDQGFRDTGELIRLQIARFADDILRERYRSRPGPREQQLLERAA